MVGNRQARLSLSYLLLACILFSSILNSTMHGNERRVILPQFVQSLRSPVLCRRIIIPVFFSSGIYSFFHIRLHLSVWFLTSLAFLVLTFQAVFHHSLGIYWFWVLVSHCLFHFILFLIYQLIGKVCIFDWITRLCVGRGWFYTDWKHFTHSS